MLLSEFDITNRRRVLLIEFDNGKRHIFLIAKGHICQFYTSNGKRRRVLLTEFTSNKRRRFILDEFDSSTGRRLLLTELLF